MKQLWKIICLAYQGDIKHCTTPCLHCARIEDALAVEMAINGPIADGLPPTTLIFSEKRMCVNEAMTGERCDMQCLNPKDCVFDLDEEPTAKNRRRAMDDLGAMARAAEKNERLSDGALYGKLADEIERLRSALEKIANTDYRGNRPTEQFIAYNALNGLA